MHYSGTSVGPIHVQIVHILSHGIDAKLDVIESLNNTFKTTEIFYQCNRIYFSISESRIRQVSLFIYNIFRSLKEYNSAG